jgi:hypothetical protein
VGSSCTRIDVSLGKCGQTPQRKHGPNSLSLGSIRFFLWTIWPKKWGQIAKEKLSQQPSFLKGKKMKTIYSIEDVIQGRRRLLRKKLEPNIFYTNHLFSPLPFYNFFTKHVLSGAY